MAEEEVEELQQETRRASPPPKKSSPLRYLPLVVILLLLQSVGAYFLIKWQLERGDEPIAEPDEAGRVRIFPEGDEPEATVDLGEIVANPRVPGARLFVFADITLAVGPSGVVSEIEGEENFDRIRDQIIAALSGARPEDLQTPEGRENVKADIIGRLNDFLYDGQVMAVYFSSFRLQASPGYVEGQ